MRLKTQSSQSVSSFLDLLVDRGVSQDEVGRFVFIECFRPLLEHAVFLASFIENDQTP